ncbi:MAG TPA: hypothetical protein VHC22_21770 [Pirellulales bacterium]|nr:hypothetical protein [Pirellulales bacterium]
MHCLMLVTISLPSDVTSTKARSAAYEALISDPSFCGDGGQFSSPVCDWFVIGGRFSGLLAETVVGDAYRKDAADQESTALDAIWNQHGGIGPSPKNRNDCDDLGYPDDAMPLTPQLYAELLGEFEGNAVYRDGLHCEFADLDGEQLKPDFAGRKWLVVVDYHN